MVGGDRQRDTARCHSHGLICLTLNSLESLSSHSSCTKKWQMQCVIAANPQLSLFADPSTHIWHIIPWAMSPFPTSSICLTFKCHLQETQTFRLWQEALHSKVGTVSLVHQLSALKLGQDNLSCVFLHPVADSLPDEATSALSQSCLMCL